MLLVSFFVECALKRTRRFAIVNFIYKRAKLFCYTAISSAYIKEILSFLFSEYVLYIFFIQEICFISEHAHDIVVFYS